jgi:hypothetical protein
MKKNLEMNLQKFATFAGLLSKGAVLAYIDGATTKTIAAVKIYSRNWI